MNTTAIAQHLNVTELAIIEVQEWAHVLWVRVKNLGARFVSKRVVEMEETKKSVIEWTLTGSTRRQQAQKKWVARIIGKDVIYTFKRQFIKAANVEWGRVGMTKAVFEITEPGYYQDSDGDFFEVYGNELDYRMVSYQEVKFHVYGY